MQTRGTTCAGAFIMAGVLGLGFALPAAGRQGPGDPLARRAALELQKLQLEVAGLRADLDASWWERSQGLLGLGAGLVLGIAGTVGSVWAARRARLGELDQAVHEARIQAYPGLVKACAPLGVFFPEGDGSEARAIGPRDCAAIGRAMSAWYFGVGGLLMSAPGRDAYFKLARALTRAAAAAELHVPVFPRDAMDISVEKLREYRGSLGIEGAHPHLRAPGVEDWTFGGPPPEGERPAMRFKDYVFLQHLSSTLRTRLAEDLRGRLRPA